MQIIIGNKRFSSWSLRPWLLLKHYEIPFEELLIPLDTPTSHADILKHSPSGKVPLLKDGDLIIWESLAIAEYLNEKFPEKNMWPKNPKVRAKARAVANEMHAGFQDLRSHMPHDLHKELSNFDHSPAKADIARIQQIWTECLQEFKGPFLFGDFSIADAMYAPVVNRFVSYGVPLIGTIKTYVDAVRTLPAHKVWIEQAKAETLQMPRYT